MRVDPNKLLTFIAESNKIEGLFHDPVGEVDAYMRFLTNDEPNVGDLVAFVRVIAPHKPLRTDQTLNVHVGNHIAPMGGPEIGFALQDLMKSVRDNAKTPYEAHVVYETLHPFMDGNGRSGRLVWLWHMMCHERWQPPGFLHQFYYQSLAASRTPSPV